MTESAARKRVRLSYEGNRELLALVAQGFTNEEISAQLHISSRTVNDRIARMRDRLGARNKTHLITLAYQHGYLLLPTTPERLVGQLTQMLGACPVNLIQESPRP